MPLAVICVATPTSRKDIPCYPKPWPEIAGAEAVGGGYIRPLYKAEEPAARWPLHNIDVWPSRSTDPHKLHGND